MTKKPMISHHVASAASGLRHVFVRDLDLMALMGRRARICGSTLRARSSGEKAVLIATLGSLVVPALAAGRLRVPVAATFRLTDAAGAYERFAAGGKLGKIVLTGGA